MSYGVIANDQIQRTALSNWMQEIAPFGILTTDSQLRVRGWNQWLELRSGMSEQQVVGRSLVEVFPELKTRQLERYFQRALTGETSVLSHALHGYVLPLPTTIVGTAHTYMQQTVRIAPLFSNQEILGTITIVEDVSQRESQAATLRRQHEREKLLSWGLAHLLQSSDPLLDVAALFPRVAEHLGLEVYVSYLLSPDGQSLQLHSGGGLTSDQQNDITTIDLEPGLFGRCARERRPVHEEHLQASTDPHCAEARQLGLRSFAGFPLVIGERLLGLLAFASFTRDTIARDELEFLSFVAQYVAIAFERGFREKALRDAQRRLAEYAETLETKVAERTARLHETIAQLESFSYTVAHDLRAPIRALKGYSEVLLEDYGAAIPADGHDILHKLHRSSNRLDALTRDLLTFSRVSRQNVLLTPVDVAELVQDIVLLTPALHDDVLVVLPPLGVVWAQRTLLQQCLSNLFDNAVKFVGSGMRPSIVVRAELHHQPGLAREKYTLRPFQSATQPGAKGPAEPPSPDRPERGVPVARRRVRIWVEDNGIGIAPQSHDKIFGVFERLGGQDGPEGTGIGLAIVARASQQMGGACGVESSPGQGSRFWIDLYPADEPAPALSKDPAGL